MKLAGRKVLTLLLLFIVGSASACGGEEEEDGASVGEVNLVTRGREAFEANCAACHGEDLQGTKTGPPLLDPIYAPNHHPDEAFFSAVANGVQPHHWEFGPMPPQPAVSEDDVEAIVEYVRAEQEKASITEDPSHP